MRDEKKRGSRNAERGMKDKLLSVQHSSFRVQRLPSSLILHPSSLIIVWAIMATLTLLFVSMIVVAPLALAHGHDVAALVIYSSFGKFCHQIPARSFYLDGHPFAVCARCTGIYFGAALGVVCYPLLRSLKDGAILARKWLLVAFVPMALDFGLDFFGVWQNTHLSRAVTGAILGAVAAFYVVPGLLDLSRMLGRRSSI